jgi:CheY-like chemotaxis protein
MIVEDEQSFHDLYEIMLEDRDYEIIHTYDGDEALSKLAEKKPDLIILAILLDTMTGDTLFRYLKSMPEYTDISVIVVSNFSADAFKNLKELDPNIVFLEKAYLTKERLLKEVDYKLIEKVNAKDNE